MKYTLFNPNKFLVPVMLKQSDGYLEQKNLAPRESIEISSEQFTDVIKNLVSSPRNILRLKPIDNK